MTGRTGAGIPVAVIDSGIRAGHPHVGAVAGGICISPGSEHRDHSDRQGHGTAVAAAIREKAPGVELYAVRVFESSLATTAEVLARAIDWSAARGCRLVNLSLGTANPERAPMLRAAVERAAASGSLVVSARAVEGVRWWPGSAPRAAGVLLDADCPRDELRISFETDGPIFHASGYPRPIPGVPPERNLRGISFAVANVTGFLARLLEDRPAVTTLEALQAVLEPGIG